jgi:hypothetical protein
LAINWSLVNSVDSSQRLRHKGRFPNLRLRSNIICRNGKQCEPNKAAKSISLFQGKDMGRYQNLAEARQKRIQDY